MKNDKIPIYLMPGMAASPSIFEHIRLPEDRFEVHLLEWFVPERRMTLSEYAAEMNKCVTADNPVLLGVSFGGVVVQEMAKLMKVRKVIIVSSVKKSSELPKRMRLAKYTKIHKLLPTRIVGNIEFLAKYAFGEPISKRLELYEQYLSVRDKHYLDWAINQMVNWKQREYLDRTVHIHGEKDSVFPIGRIKNCIRVRNGTHTMILHGSKWFNEHLPTIILE